ncbi:TorD/DmsD family molecular chaperone [Eggerthella sinensis]|uniref:TorD/DmsD family molecular chaperone n=1 Tax=Eggerthella sinensis TaxID=242230 RepID=UPI001D07096D|nr:molecular chaperone TorD family protein [Eggerthella sinensis]MCB7037830.1 molecular chaperone TorD family protein [Eggerthella sinensis]
MEASHALERELPVEASLEEARLRREVYRFLAGACCDKLADDAIERLRHAEALPHPVESGEAFEGLHEGLECIERFAAESRTQDVEQLRRTLAVEFTKLFRGVREGYGPTPPFEYVFAGTALEQRTESMRATNVFYAELGLDTAYPESRDFIALELDLMAHLIGRRVDALEANDATTAAYYLERERTWLSDHLSTWIPRYCEEALPFARSGFYRGVLMMLDGLIKQDLASCAQAHRGHAL